MSVTLCLEKPEWKNWWEGGEAVEKILLKWI
jgi:hypothetical protein